jgi:hypothetical protein
MKLTTGYATYAVPTERGFFPENVVHWFPIVPSSYINLAFLTSQGIHFTGASFEDLMLILETINIICILILIIFFIHLFIKWLHNNLTPFNWFFLLGFVTSITLCGVVGYASLTYAVQKGLLHDWNYVYEPRYFAFVNVFLQIAFIGWMFLYERPKNSFLKIISWCLSILLLIEVTHNVYFYTKVAINFTKYKSAVYREQDYSYFISLMNDIKNKYPGYEIWGSAPGDNFYQYLTTYKGYIGIADAANLKSNSLTVKNKTILALMLYDHEVDDYKSLLSSKIILQTDKKNNSNFYLIELKP